MVAFNNPDAMNREEWVAYFNSEKRQRLLLELARTIAKSTGLEITFEGVYRQGFLDEHSLESITPFVIAQLEFQKELLLRQSLVGSIFEIGKNARIRNGIIRQDYVKFEKLYLPLDSSSPLPGLRPNPNPIFYEGTADADGVYRGKWRFSSDVGDLAREGTFELISVR